MATLKAKFDNIDFEQIEGYRISVAFTPKNGFEDCFFVYLWDSVDAHTSFDHEIKMPEGKPQRGELTISDKADITYKFPDIDLNHIELGMTRSERYRILEFRYARDRLDRENLAEISLENSSDAKLSLGRPEEDYDFKIDSGSPEHLLGFRARLTPSESNVFRFTSWRNDSNSFLEKLVEVNRTIISGRMQAFTIDFKQQRFEVNHKNLLVMFAEESYGRFLQFALPQFSDVIGYREGGRQEIARFHPSDFSAKELDNHDTKDMFQRAETATFIETATVLFTSGEYRDTIVK